MNFLDIDENKLKNIVEYILDQNKNNIFLVGDLGAGKTRLVREICKKNNIDYVLSPTFTIVNVYEGLKRFYHIDLYRLKSLNDFYDIGLDEILSFDDSIKLVEWADIFPQIIKDGVLVEIKIKSETTRDFFIKEV
ncbi:MAG TPA: tRNA (adenosine(37)-N6)-threonylcarbamoyltransferase complex ATPase subunit type 1 TsaE [Spirochaetota bacterium]|nr:tRNA (adenosine(37)-N6)-threonylcarbamoyltransferase complex ATPase subunit type 1 TsaE [Spirochaetota bacterium]HOM38680.1 tRNA (adenosine(37)-N6)-threonylcarbamoyltransferase complex ATPase subunit type 1 TsaE [Spirochaetota bacterium]HPQ49805.1 tRNA (adenosine(37)-N6)-threonylcarbamoyltransferase complex ATPase subunit type 1 TsaE [Spirochaetota bacterium]